MYVEVCSQLESTFLEGRGPHPGDLVSLTRRAGAQALTLSQPSWPPWTTEQAHWLSPHSPRAETEAAEVLSGSEPCI